MFMVHLGDGNKHTGKARALRSDRGEVNSGEADVSAPIWRRTVAIMETNTEYIAAQPNTIETVYLYRRRLYAFLRAYERPYMTQVICRGVGAFEDQPSLLETCVHSISTVAHRQAWLSQEV